MSFLVYLLLFIIVLIFGLNVRLISLFFVDIFRKNKPAPYVWSFDKELLLMKHNIRLQKGKKMVDLWCGDGKALRFFVKHFGIQWFWYDINKFAIIWGRFLNSLFGFKTSVIIERKNFMDIDLSTFDYIYVYLLPDQLSSIEHWIWMSAKKGAIIIANTFHFQNHQPFEIIKNKSEKPRIFLYKK